MNYRILFIHHSAAVIRFIVLFSLVILGSHFYITSTTHQKIQTNFSVNQSLYNKQINSSSKKKDAQCSTYHFKPINPNVFTTHTSLPIYDFFVFHKEFDILEMRLYELYDYVTFFLIAESPLTFTGKDKPLYLKENWSKFAKYHDKMRRIEVELDRNVNSQWSNEHRMRNDGLRLALATITDTKYIVLTSDTDEIPKARFMNALFHCPLPDPFRPLVLNCDFYYYSYEFRSKHHVLFGPSVNLVTRNESHLIFGNNIRNERFNYQFMRSTCFHCTWCFNKLEEVRSKMSSYSHTEHNQAQFQTRDHILNRYRYGKDLFDRAGEEYIYIRNNTDYPQLVQLQRERFLYMTGRSRLSNVGFIDA